MVCITTSSRLSHVIIVFLRLCELLPVYFYYYFFAHHDAAIGAAGHVPRQAASAASVCFAETPSVDRV